MESWHLGSSIKKRNNNKTKKEKGKKIPNDYLEQDTKPTLNFSESDERAIVHPWKPKQHNSTHSLSENTLFRFIGTWSN